MVNFIFRHILPYIPGRASDITRLRCHAQYSTDLHSLFYHRNRSCLCGLHLVTRAQGMALQRPCFNLTHIVSCTCHEERRCQVISEFDDGRDVLEAGSVTLAPAGPLRFLITSFPASCLVLTFRVCGIASVVPTRPGLEAGASGQDRTQQSEFCLWLCVSRYILWLPDMLSSSVLIPC